MTFLSNQLEKKETGEQTKEDTKPSNSPPKTLEQRKEEAKALKKAGKLTEKGYDMLIASLEGKTSEEQAVVKTNDELELEQGVIEEEMVM